MNKQPNIHSKTVTSFSDEWSRYDQTELSSEESKKIFNDYFSIFPWDSISDDAEGFDMGCGTGRWARWVAEKVGRLHCIDPSSAIEVARVSLAGNDNIIFHQASVDDNPLPLASQDFGYSLGVLHHVPDTQEAIKKCADILKPGAPLLLYLYYAFDNRSKLFKSIWHLTDFIRGYVSRMPSGLKRIVTESIALFVYLPLAYLSKLLELVGFSVDGVPLSYYRHQSFYTMRTDARDRFGTPLENRFSKKEIKLMMEQAGLSNIQFSDSAPFWCVCGLKND